MTRAVVVLLAGPALLASACGGSRPSGVAQLGSTAKHTTSSQASRALAYSRCMRSNGVLNYPDPSSSGATDKSKVIAARSTVDGSRFAAAVNACRHLLPASPPGPTPAEVQRVMNGMQDFATCMRSHGVPSWPGPYLDVGRPTFDIHGLDYRAPRASAAIRECRHLLPGSTEPRICSTLLAEQNGDPAGDERCFGG